jgi:TusA-related sulfurtransferase
VNDKGGHKVSSNPAFTSIGNALLDALAVRDFDRIGKLLHPDIRFRGLVPHTVREGTTAEETLSWLRRWFGDADVFNLTQFSIDQVVDRLHIAYRVHVHNRDGWQEVAQHIYCIIQNDVIGDMALLCSGFRPVPEEPFVRQQSDFMAFSSTQARSEANLFYDGGDKGCAEGPLEQIAQLARRLSAGQTMEVHATNPSVTHDLPAWCRLAGYELLYQDGDRYLIGRPHAEV